MTEEHPERLRHSEDELPVWQVEENLIGQMLGTQQCPLAAAGWAEVEALGPTYPGDIILLFHYVDRAGWSSQIIYPIAI